MNTTPPNAQCLDTCNDNKVAFSKIERTENGCKESQTSLGSKHIVSSLFLQMLSLVLCFKKLALSTTSAFLVLRVI